MLSLRCLVDTHSVREERNAYSEMLRFINTVREGRNAYSEMLRCWQYCEGREECLL